MFIYSESQREEVAEGEADDELVIIGLEVDDEERVISTSQFDNSVHFPAPRSTLSGGQKYVVMMPDSGLSRLYSDDRFDVYHDPSEIAKCFLDSNYLAPAVYGRQADIDVRREVFDFMGLDDVGVDDSEQEYRAQLREIAGIDDPEVEEEEASTEVERLKEEYKYTELKSMASEAGIDNANQKKDELAEWLAENTDE